MKLNPLTKAAVIGLTAAGVTYALAQIGYGYIPNRKGVTMNGDPRDVALRRALYAKTPVRGDS